MARFIVDFITDKKGENIVLLDIREQSVIADYFVICTGNSSRQLRGLVNELVKETRKQHKLRPMYSDGEADTGWVLLDYGDVMVHAFSPEIRQYYDLEGVWEESPVLLKIQ